MTQAFCRELDGGQWIFDLMGQTSRHLPPGGIALGLNQGGHVVEHDDVFSLGIPTAVER